MNGMTTHTAVEDHEVPRAECWCCGTVGEPAGMVHLGNHPEVAMCVRCAYWAAKQAWQLEDRGKGGPLVFARDQLRGLRRLVVQHGWQHNPVLRGPIRWLGKHLP